jgi:hypothetical protein
MLFPPSTGRVLSRVNSRKPVPPTAVRRPHRRRLRMPASLVSAHGQPTGWSRLVTRTSTEGGPERKT